LQVSTKTEITALSKSNLKKVLWALGILFIITTIGVFGFMIIEEDSFIDALYLTVITISTVGFGLPHELTNGGKIFTIFLILFSFGNYAYAISIITTYLVQLQINDVLGIRSKKTGKHMKDHVIICGFGRNGQKVAEELGVRKQSFVVIDQNHELIMNYNGDPIKFIEGDATEDETLLKAGIENAKAIVSTMPLDADNLFVVLSSRALNPKVTIVSRASSKSTEHKLHVAGVDHVVLPEGVGGSHMAKLVTRSDVLEFLDHLSITGPSETILEVIRYNELPDEFHHKTIMEMAVRQVVGANIVGFKTPDGEFIINPSPSTIIAPDSKIFILGTPEQIEKIKKTS
jgi:voltage-gated potassium channel